MARYGEGFATFLAPFDDSAMADKPHDRELLSAAYYRVLKREFDNLAVESTAYFSAPGGLMDRVADFVAEVKELPDAGEEENARRREAIKSIRLFAQTLLRQADEVERINRLVQNPVKRPQSSHRRK